MIVMRWDARRYKWRTQKVGKSECWIYKTVTSNRAYKKKEKKIKKNHNAQSLYI